MKNLNLIPEETNLGVVSLWFKLYFPPEISTSFQGPFRWLAWNWERKRYHLKQNRFDYQPRFRKEDQASQLERPWEIEPRIRK